MSEIIEHTPNLWRVYDAFNSYNQPPLTKQEKRDAGREYVLMVRRERADFAARLRNLLGEASIALSDMKDRKHARSFIHTLARSMIERHRLPPRVSLPSLSRERQRLLSAIYAYEHPSESEQRRRNAMWCGEQDALEMEYQGMRAQLIIVSEAIGFLHREARGLLR